MPAETATLENNTRQSTSFAGRRIEQLGSSGTNAAKALGNIPKKLLNGLGSITQAVVKLPLARAAKDGASATAAPPLAVPAPPPQPDHKPANDVVAGAMARAASQGTIHPLDTMKVRMQTVGRISKAQGVGLPPRVSGASVSGGGALASSSSASTSGLSKGLHELKGLYKGVGGAATGAGIIIGTYFAFYSSTKRFLREHTTMTNEAGIAFVSGAAAAVGSSVVKVPLAVCIRSVQAGVYRNVLDASKSIVAAAGVRGLFTGFLPTLLEDVPDMAVKFAVYETLRTLHRKMTGNRPPTIIEDLLVGGTAGAAAAAATTPLDVVKTLMMCSASSRPTITSAARILAAEGRGLRPFFRGVGPRALSNGLNSAIFFCFFEAIRQVLVKRQAEAAALSVAAPSASVSAQKLPAVSSKNSWRVSMKKGSSSGARSNASPATACLSLAIPVRYSR